MRRGRTDANHSEIVQAMRDVGAYVVDCSQFGSGFPDLVVAWRGRWFFVEVKDGKKPPSKRKLTADQQIFHADAANRGCQVHVVKNESEALALLGAKRAA